MARERLCKVCGGWHDLGKPWPDNCREPVWIEQKLAAPRIATDTMGPVQSMTNGKMYDSKSALRAEYRRAGVVEVGNDVPLKKPAPDRAALKKQRQATIGKALSRTGFGAP